VAERYNMAAALLVNRMLGLRNVQQFEAETTPGERAWERGRFKDKDGQLWRELGMNELVYNGDFLQAGL
jgi:hypothetical protein